LARKPKSLDDVTVLMQGLDVQFCVQTRKRNSLGMSKLKEETEMNFFVQFGFHLVVVIFADIVLHFGWVWMTASHITI
jgi:hypothetical protein